MIKKLILTQCFFILCFFIAQGENITREKKVPIGILSRVEVKNNQIYAILDSLLLYSNDCIFTKCNLPYLLTISTYIDDNNPRLVFSSYHESTFHFIDEFSFDRYKYYFHYKNHLVIIAPSTDFLSIYFSQFFIETTEKQLFYCLEDNFDNHITLSFVCLSYFYKNNTFVPIEKTFCNSYSIDGDYYRVRKKDTWRRIAKRFNTTTKKLKLYNGTRKKFKLQKNMRIKVVP